MMDNSCQVDVRWVENNGSYEARVAGEYRGLVSQTPDHPSLMNPGKWGAAWKNRDGGLSSDGPFDTSEEAKIALVAGVSC
jgi:hypothetical protein